MPFVTLAYDVEVIIKLEMNNSLLPEMKFDISSKSLGLQSIPSQKLMSFKLFHIEKLAKRPPSNEKYDSEKEMSLIQYFHNKDILSALPKPAKKAKRFIRIKSSLDECHSYITANEPEPFSNAKPLKRRDRLFTLSNKRFSTSCTNNEESPDDRSQPQLLDQLRQTKTLQTGVGIRVVKKKRKVTINEFMEMKNREVREYEYSKLSRTDIIPNYLVFSKKSSQDQERRLIKNISERVYPTYKLCPNFHALQQ